MDRSTESFLFLTILILCCLFFCVSRIYPPCTQQARIAGDLIELRNKSVFAFLMFNALFVLIVFLLQLNKDQLHVIWPLGVKTNITYVEETSEVSDHQASRQGKRRCHWDVRYIRVWCIIKIILDALRLLAETFISQNSKIIKSNYYYYFKQLLSFPLLSGNYFDKGRQYD